MNNRVDYLSDKLVNLRGKLKSADELVPPESIANGVSVNNAAPNRQASAQERRKEQTFQLATDYEQRLIRRAAQLEAHAEKLQKELEYTAILQQQIAACKEELSQLKLNISGELSPSQIGEGYRAVDKARLGFFDTDGRIELLLLNNGKGGAENSCAAAPAAPENFKSMLARGWALALTLGLVLAAALIAGALLIMQAWR